MINVETFEKQSYQYLEDRKLQLPALAIHHPTRFSCMWLCSVERLGFVAEREYNALVTDAHEESDKCLCGNMQRITKYKDMTVYAIIRVIKYLRKETAVEKIDTIQITPTAM